MPVLFSYLLKLSLSLSVVYLFYQLILRRLTFYNWNRFYLLCYTLLSFFIPFINITPVLERNEMTDNRIVQFIPNIGTMNGSIANSPFYEKTGFIESLTIWNWFSIVIAAGIVIMLFRLLIQLLSFRKIINKAELVSGEEVNLYQVNESIIPFSFGKSIFLNPQLHNEEELKEIIRHEFVHVKQRHSVDIIWAEVLCILNWYNPFVWLTRKAMRQNLEFIADNKVLQSGIDKKQYQYLLLKVIGNNHFSIANQFNFSSLKKRIAMMNKMRSAKVHLLKFLFLLPLLAVLILSFRTVRRQMEASSKEYFASGIIYDRETNQPLADALIMDNEKGVETKSDEKGFYVISFPVTENSNGHFGFKISKEGYKDATAQFGFGGAGSTRSGVVFIGIVKVGSQNGGSAVSSVGAKDENGNNVLKPGYELVKSKFDKQLEQKRLEEKIDKMVEGYEKPIWIIDGIPYAIGEGMKAWFSKEEVEKSPEFRVWVDGKIMTMDEANRTVNRFKIKSIGAWSKKIARKNINVNYNLLLLGINKEIDSFIKNKDQDNDIETEQIQNQATVSRALEDQIIKTSFITGQFFNLSGIVYDNTTDLPLSDVTLVETASGINTITNNNGFYKIAIPVTASGRQEIKIKFSRKSYLDNERRIEIEFDAGKNRSCIGIFSLLAGNHQGEHIKTPLFYSAKDRSGNSIANPEYDLVKAKFESYFRKKIADTSVFEKKIFSIEDVKIEKITLSKADTIPAKPVIAINSQKSSSVSLLPDSVLYIVDGKETTADVLKKVKGEAIQSINVLKSNAATEKYGQRAKNGVVEIILKPSLRLKEPAKTDSILLKADSISWNAEKKQLYFKGNSVLKNKWNSTEVRAENIVMNESELYISFDGKQIIPDKDYTSKGRASYLIIGLNKNEAFKKYGDKARNGAIEITTQND